MFNMLGFVLNNSYIHPNTIMERYDFIYFHPLVGLFFLISMYNFLIIFNNISFCFLLHSLLFFSILFLQNQHCIKMMANKILIYCKVNIIQIITICLNNSQISHISSRNTFKEAWDELLWLFEVQDYVIEMYLMEWVTLLKMKDFSFLCSETCAQFKKFLELLSMAKNLMKYEDAWLMVM